jgi:hypothetical protein
MNIARQAQGRAFALSVALIGLIAAFYLATLRAGHPWGDDFALYLLHARNLVTGRAYADTGYIYNPAFPELSPRVYPPVLPLLLLPFYATFGLNLTLLKLIPIFGLIVALCAIERALHPTLTLVERLTVIAGFGFNPFFWDYKDTIASEFPFLLFVVVCLWLIHRAYRQADRPGWGAIAAASLALYLVYGTRSIGLVLIPALWIYEFVVTRQPGRFALQVTALFAICAGLQALLIPGGGSYFNQFNVTVNGVLENVVSLTKALADFVDNGYSNVWQAVLFALVSGLGLIGVWRRWRSGLTFWDIATVVYGLVTLLWPEAYWGRRFLIPVIPLYFFYMVVGLRWLVERWRWPRYGVALSLVAGLIGLAYAARYTQMDFGAIREGIGDPEAQAVFEYVRQQTPPGAVFIFQKPRALALFTSRSASAYDADADDATLWEYFQSIHADYVIVARDFKDDGQTLAPFVARQTHGLGLVYTNADFEIYRIEP